MKHEAQKNAPAGAVYGFGFIGVLGFLKAIVWPVFLVYEAFKHFMM